MANALSLTAVGLWCCLCGVVAAHAQAPKGNRVSTELKFEFNAEGGLHFVVLDVLLPKTEPGRQKITAINYSKKPKEVYEKEGQLYAQFVVKSFPADLVVGIEADVYRYDLTTARTSPHRSLANEESLKQWQVHELYLEKYSRGIDQTAKSCRGASQEATVQNCFDFVVKNLKKSAHTKNDIGAAQTFADRSGDCTEFADLFIALCRANEIPARFCEGYLLAPVDDTPNHDWAEVYLDELGWVPFDPLYAHIRSGTSFRQLRPIYLLVERQRRNGTLGLKHFYSFRYEGTKDCKANVKDTFTVKSSVELP